MSPQPSIRNLCRAALISALWAPLASAAEVRGKVRTQNGQPVSITQHASGHEQMWFAGASMNGTASWAVVAVVTGLFIILAANGGFE